MGKTRLKILMYILSRPMFPPSLREIAKACGNLRVAGIHKHVAALRRDGWISRGEAYEARTYVAKCRFVPSI